MTGRLLGHARVESTARYAHLAQDSVRRSADRVSCSIAEDVLGSGGRGADRVEEPEAAPASRPGGSV